jgi:hypothetical protein
LIKLIAILTLIYVSLLLSVNKNQKIDRIKVDEFIVHIAVLWVGFESEVETQPFESEYRIKLETC